MNAIVRKGAAIVAFFLSSVFPPTFSFGDPPAVPVIKADFSKREIVIDNSLNTQCNIAGDQETAVRNVVDEQMHAFRRDDGKVQLFASDRFNFSIVGNSLDKVELDGCRKVYEYPRWSSNPADFRGYQWFIGAFKEASGKIVGFVHNEFHGERFLNPRPAVCTTAKPLNCWYGSTLTAETSDGGRTFVPATGPSNVLATLPIPFTPGGGHLGYADPAISRGPKGDNFIYLFIGVTAPNDKLTGQALTRTGGSGSCVMRGNGTNPSGWRMWGGSAFDVTTANPYAPKAADAGDHRCQLVLPFRAKTVKYLPGHDIFIALGEFPREQQIVYAASSDLVHWSDPKVLGSYAQKMAWTPGQSAPSEYFSLLDPSSSSRNFDTLESRPYLYFQELVISNGRRTGFDRIVRVPLTISFKVK